MAEKMESLFDGFPAAPFAAIDPPARRSQPAANRPPPETSHRAAPRPGTAVRAVIDAAAIGCLEILLLAPMTVATGLSRVRRRLRLSARG
jgi:hypothetical protein